MADTRTFTAARNGATAARLELVHGGTRINVRPADIDEVCRAVFDGVVPKATAEGGHVRITYPRFSLAELTRHPAHRAHIELSSRVPWSIVFDGGLGDSAVDLSGLELQGFEISGGAGDLQVLLPKPRGLVGVSIRGGASKLTVLHPERTAVGLRIGGGATKLAFDGKDIDSQGGETRLETPSYADASDRYEIEIRGGASRLTVAEHNGLKR